MGDYDLTVLEQYPIEVNSVRKVRGAVLCDTDSGLLLLKEAALSQTRIMALNEIHRILKEQQNMESDTLVANKEGEYISASGDGRKYYLKTWFPGRECDVRKTGEILEASRNLAKLHRAMRLPAYGKALLPDDLPKEWGRHNRELKKVRAFIRKKTIKGEFETAFLRYFDSMYEVAVSVEKQLGASVYGRLKKEAEEKGCMTHGEYNYHNLIITPQGQMRTVNFERMCTDIQAADFYYFLRKVMEKHQWNEKLGAEMLRAYSAVNPLSEGEKEYISLRLSYPEKFWKCANMYYNTNKAWISSKSVEKLRLSIEQAEVKKRFLEQIFSFHLSGSGV